MDCTDLALGGLFIWWLETYSVEDFLVREREMTVTVHFLVKLQVATHWVASTLV